MRFLDYIRKFGRGNLDSNGWCCVENLGFFGFFWGAGNCFRKCLTLIKICLLPVFLILSFFI